MRAVERTVGAALRGRPWLELLRATHQYLDATANPKRMNLCLTAC